MGVYGGYGTVPEYSITETLVWRDVTIYFIKPGLEVLASLPRLLVLDLRKVILVQDKNSDPIDLTGNTVAGVNPLSQVFNTNSLYIHPQPFY